MSNIVINGIKGANGQPVRIGEDGSGPYMIAEWHGTRNEINDLIPLIAGSGGTWEVQRSFTGAKDVISGRFPLRLGEVEESVNDWEFFANVVEKHILESDSAVVAAISEDDLAIIREAMQTGVFTDPDFGDAEPDYIFKLAKRGVTSVKQPAPVLRHTQTVSSVWTVKAALSNIRRIYSTATLEIGEQVPSSLLINLPVETPVNAMFQYGWYKNFPTVRISAHKKVQIEQEWEYGLWPAGEYPSLYGLVL